MVNVILRIAYLLYTTLAATFAIVFILILPPVFIAVGIPVFIITGKSIADNFINDTWYLFPMGPMRVYEFSKWIERRNG